MKFKDVISLLPIEKQKEVKRWWIETRVDCLVCCLACVATGLTAGYLLWGFK